MFKHVMLAAATLTMVAAPMAASAQSWRDHDRDRYDRRDDRWDRRGDRRDDRWDRRDDRRDDRWDRRDDRWDRRAGRRGDRWDRDDRRDYRGYRSRWNRGAVIPYDYRSRWYINDYRRYGYAPPPRGYGYYRTDTGDVVLALIATGVILSLLND